MPSSSSGPKTPQAVPGGASGRMARGIARTAGGDDGCTPPHPCGKVPAPMADTTQALERLAVAVLIGFLVGLDRERAEARKERPLFAGVRTFPLIALMGAIPMLLPPPTGLGLVVAGFLGVSAIATLSYRRTSAAGDVGATTEIAALATFLLGTLAGAGQLVVAASAGVIVAVLLVAKPRLEAFSVALRSEELAAALELAVISVIVLPLLPDAPYGPGGVLNPREIWIVVVLVSALSFAAFVGVRFLGERRSMALTGLLGGLVSSTAMTVAMAQRSRAGGSARASAGAAVLASAVMPVRIGVLAGGVDPAILPDLLPILVAMATTGAAAAWWLARGASDEAGGAPALRNPFSLTHGGRIHFGRRGLYATAVLSGMADVDAPSIAFTRLGPVAGDWLMPATAVTIAAVSNTLVKAALAVALGAGRFRVLAGGALATIALAGSAGIVWLGVR